MEPLTYWRNLPRDIEDLLLGVVNTELSPDEAAAILDEVRRGVAEAKAEIGGLRISIAQIKNEKQGTPKCTECGEEILITDRACHLECI